MRLVRFAAAAAAVYLACTAVVAQDRNACAAEMVCASKPETVMAAMEKAGLKPKLSEDNGGDPMIESEEATYRFNVFFYGCEKNLNCDSLRFEAIFVKEPENTPELANKWNRSNRFVQAAIKEDGRFVAAYDVATIGGVNARNFADVLDWWTSMLGELGEFFQKEVPPKPAAAKS